MRLQKVSETALVRRVNTSLKKQGKQLHKASRGRKAEEFGRYYLTPSGGNAVLESHVDLYGLAKALGVSDKSRFFA